MKKLFTTILISVFVVVLGYSQTLTATIGTISANAGDYILVPVNVTGFNKIGSLGLKIKFDNNVMSYVSIINKQSSIASMLVNLIQNDTLKMGWYSSDLVNGTNIGDVKLFDIKFSLIGGSSTICFDTIKSYASDVTEKLKVKWICGEVKQINGINELGNVNAESGINVYPNPAIGFVNIKIGIRNEELGLKKDIYKLILRNIEGQEVYNGNADFSNSYKLDISNFSNGLYFLSLTNDKENYVSKVVIQK